MYLPAKGGSGVRQRLSAVVSNWRLQHILIISFILMTAITIGVGSLMIYRLIDNYLGEAQADRVSRDMDLALAFYNNKMSDISSTARRIGSMRSVEQNLVAADVGDRQALQVLQDAVENELSNLPSDTQRFIVITNAEGKSVAGMVASHRQFGYVLPKSDWAEVPIVNDVLAEGRGLSATEVMSGSILAWVGLDKQAYIPLIDTPKAAPKPYDRREGTAGLTLISVVPVVSEDGELVGSVLAGHLFNNDFTLVDRISEVAGVDTATLFFGDLRVSTNVPLDATGKRAIGTRVSQEVFDEVLVKGQEFTGQAFVVNQNYITRYKPLYDHTGRIVGMLYVGAKQAAFQRLLSSFGQEVFLIAATTLLLSIIIAVPLAWSIGKPLRQLAEATRKVAEGDWSVRVPVDGFQEIRTQAESFNTMVETLKGTQEQLVRKEQLASVGQLAAGVAHEINNPLGSVLLYADILRKETPNEDQQRREDLEMIMREATRCKVIVNDLLNFSRQNEVLAQDTDLNAMICELAEEQGKRPLFSEVEISTELDPTLNTIQADPLQLHQVFINLMNNAAEAMPDGGKLTLRTRQGPTPGYVTIEVQDTGVGISEENMKKLFTPFFTTKPIGKGTGLGLAITYGIVKMHRGQITVQSQVGVGTTFTITFQEHLPTQKEESQANVTGPKVT
jgi:two-component system, NtrC family, sensor kinase